MQMQDGDSIVRLRAIYYVTCRTLNDVAVPIVDARSDLWLFRGAQRSQQLKHARLHLDLGFPFSEEHGRLDRYHYSRIPRPTS